MVEGKMRICFFLAYAGLSGLLLFGGLYFKEGFVYKPAALILSYISCMQTFQSLSKVSFLIIYLLCKVILNYNGIFIEYQKKFMQEKSVDGEKLSKEKKEKESEIVVENFVSKFFRQYLYGNL